MTTINTHSAESKRAWRGILTKGVGGLYSAYLTDTAPSAPEEEPYGVGETVWCRARGLFRREGRTPLVGDEVVLRPARAHELPEEQEAVQLPADRARKRRSSDEPVEEAAFVMTDILPRKSELVRPPCANLTHLFIVLPVARPDPDLLMTDKLTCVAVHAGIQPVLIVNKCDADESEAERLSAIYRLAGFPVFPLSASNGRGVEPFSAYLAAEAAAGARTAHPMRAAFAGVSGAGKSTLMTRLYPSLSLQTNTVSRKIGRGRHTTRHVELYPVQAGEAAYFLADTPGFSMLDFTRFDLLPSASLASSFPEMEAVLGSCRYSHCTHVREEGCAVLEKVQNGGMAPSRQENYCLIREEIRRKPAWERQKEKEEKTARARR